ncbi:hypothetical protein M9H77_36480 [Catharanthus roseus]|uniref:Uncharacterized protein n=1 Tax=Catharanthus roseus TaxID=4058 RepID=A0ACB9ZSS5_CATRO|nr:hypothetical protein M9H77_36480 [Catharanthus roseus]
MSYFNENKECQVINIVKNFIKKSLPPSSRWTSSDVPTRLHNGVLTPLSLSAGPHGYLGIQRFFYDKFEVFPIEYLFLGCHREALRIRRNCGVGGVGRGIINPSPFGFEGGSCGFPWCHKESSTKDTNKRGILRINTKNKTKTISS